MDEMTCVNGTVAFIDLSNYSLKAHAAISLEDRKDFAETWQVNFCKLVNLSMKATFASRLVKLPISRNS